MGSTLNDGSGMYLLDKLDGLSEELGFSAYTDGSKKLIDIFAITLALMVGTASVTGLAMLVAGQQSRICCHAPMV